MFKTTALHCAILVAISCDAIEGQTSGDKYKYRTFVEVFSETPAYNLVKSVYRNDTASVSGILAQHPELANYQESRNGTTPIIVAVLYNAQNSATLLLQAGADPNKVDKLKDAGPLQYACVWNSEGEDRAELVRSLIAHGADVNHTFFENTEKDSLRGCQITALTEACGQ